MLFQGILALRAKVSTYLALYDADYRKIMDNLKAVAEVSREVIEGEG
jgi:hypothetical protein